MPRFCHDAVPPERRAVCAACLAVQHAECFAEHGRCAACAAERLLTAAPPPAAKAPDAAEAAGAAPPAAEAPDVAEAADAPERPRSRERSD